MENICPVCNELKDKEFKCGICGGTMVNEGLIQEYYDDYSADMEIIDSEHLCAHIYKCKDCGGFERKMIKKIVV